MADKTLYQTPYESMTIPMDEHLAVRRTLETLQGVVEVLMADLQAAQNAPPTGADPPSSQQLPPDTGAVHNQAEPQSAPQNPSAEPTLLAEDLQPKPIVTTLPPQHMALFPICKNPQDNLECHLDDIPTKEEDSCLSMKL